LSRVLAQKHAKTTPLGELSDIIGEAPLLIRHETVPVLKIDPAEIEGHRRTLGESRSGERYFFARRSEQICRKMETPPQGSKLRHLRGRYVDPRHRFRDADRRTVTLRDFAERLS